MASVPRPEGNTVLLSRRLESIDTIVGIQRRLNQTGFDAGKEDDIDGPKTKSAVQQFSSIAAITPVGTTLGLLTQVRWTGLQAHLRSEPCCRFTGPDSARALRERR